MGITAYQKDTNFLQKFLAGRANGLQLDTQDVIRAERLLSQLTTKTGRSLYVTLKGKGVFCRNLGGEDTLVVRSVNQTTLNKLLARIDPPPISKKEQEAVEQFYSQGGAPADGFPLPIPLGIGSFSAWSSLYRPVDVSSEEVDIVRGESIQTLDEFLIRFRVLVRSLNAANPPKLNPHLAVDAQNPDTPAPQHVAIIQWLQARALFGNQYGLEGPNQPSPFSQCLDMMLQVPPKQGIVLLLEGFREDLHDDKGDVFLAAIRDLEFALRRLEKTTNQIILLAPGVDWKSSPVGKMLEGYSLNSPDYDDIDGIVRGILASSYTLNPSFYQKVIHNITHLPADSPEAGGVFDQAMTKVVNSLRGLLETQISEVVWTSLRSEYTLDPKMLDSARKEIINRTPGLTVYEPNVSFKDVGGMENLQSWITEKGGKLFMTADEAKEDFGGHIYKGILLLGLPGTGKSLVTKAIASYLSDNSSGYSVSLVQLDVASLRGSFVGQTEERTKEALRTIEAFAPVVLWIDEIEKAFSGAGGDSSSEISQRMLGTFLTWMQERKSPVFMVATANDISALPPEFTRKGRWDAVFFMPLPDKKSCVSILEYHLSRFRLLPPGTSSGQYPNIEKVVKNTPEGLKKFSMWRKLSYSGNFKGDATVIQKFGSSGKLEPVGAGGAGGDVVTRYLGYTGAEIEESVKSAVARAQAQARAQGVSWRDILSIDDLIISLHSMAPVAKKEAKGQPLGYVMYTLEKLADKMLSSEEIEEEKSRIMDQIQDLSEQEITDFSRLFTDIEGLPKPITLDFLSKRRNPGKKQRMFLLGSDFYRHYS